MTNKMTVLKKKKSGFTLIELLVVVLIIGILAAIAVPQYFKVVEKGKAAEALATLDSFRGAQERYITKYGQYCNASACTGWDLTVPTLKYFGQPAAPSAGAASGGASWKTTIQRNSVVSGYSNYTITVTQEPNTTVAYTCDNTSCAGDLLP